MYCVFAVACTVSIHTQCITLHYIILLVMAMNFSHRYSLQRITYCTSVLKCSRGALWCGPPLHVIQLHVKLVSSSCWVLHRGIVPSSVCYEMSLFEKLQKATKGGGGGNLKHWQLLIAKEKAVLATCPMMNASGWRCIWRVCVCESGFTKALKLLPPRHENKVYLFYLQLVQAKIC